MKKAVVLGGRIEVLNKVRTLGIVGELAGDVVAILPADLAALPSSSLMAGVNSSQLLSLVPIHDAIGSPSDQHYAVQDVCEPARALMANVSRFHPSSGRVQGFVNSLCGAVRLQTEKGQLVVFDLIEVHFDKVDADSDEPTPPIIADDAGSLVTQEGRVLGILVAGGGHVGYIVPIGPFLAESGVRYRRHNPTVGITWKQLDQHVVEAEAGNAAVGATLAREPSLQIDDMIPTEREFA